jgi:hypothetical protein
MATISAATTERIYTIDAFRGLHENPDGDTKLKKGEAAAMVNFRITRDGNLKKRPGTARIVGLLNYSYDDSDPDLPTYTINEPSSLKMYSSISIDSDGFYQGTGDVTVSGGNFNSYIGYYWIRSHDVAYILRSVNDDGTLLFSQVALVFTGSDDKVKTMWSGFVNFTEYLVVACHSHLYYLTKDTSGWHKNDIGAIDTSGNVLLFGFSNVLYILTATEYKKWDGVTLSDVTGYVPLVSVSVPPSGGGTTLEQINKLTPQRRSWFSPDGVANVFQLPETDITSVDSVKLTSDGSAVSGWTANVEAGTVTFSSVPAQGTNTIEITWTNGTGFKSQILAMKYVEFFNGAQDTRVFLYGDGTYKCIYSGVDYNGNPSAEYFPDMNELAVGDENTPIMSMIRHYQRLICYKSNSAWSIQYGTLTLEDESTIVGFYVTPINRDVGCSAPGQARLVLNSPYVPFNNDLYEWKSNSSYTGNLTADERQAKRISDRVYKTISSFDLSKCFCFDDNPSQQYFIFDGNNALVYCYAVDAWYKYENIPAQCAVSHQGSIFLGGSSGFVYELSEEYWSDCGSPISSYWESGSLDFGASNLRKFSPTMWIGIKPEPQNDVVVTVQTDRKSQYSEKVISSQIFSFDPADFGSWTFKNNDKPHMYRLKIKAKKFVFYKLIFESNTNDSGITVLAADIKVRYTGQAK